MNKNRLEAFSDGMFAIIMTIMVLDLKVPHGATIRDLLPVIPTLLCYLQSFLFVGNYWANHHHLFHVVKKVTGKMLVANMATLFMLSLIPFVTGWVGENDFAPQTVAVYAVVLILPALSWTILHKTIEQTNTWNEEVKRIMDKQAKKGILTVLIYIAGIPLAFVNPYISEGLFLLTSIMWLLPNKQLEKALEE